MLKIMTERTDELENGDLLNGIRELSGSDDVGYNSLPYQIVKKRMQGGFAFNILLIGETGMGKSTLVSTLFNVPYHVSADTHVHSGVELRSETYNLHEKGVNLKLTVVETTGFGDQINRNETIRPITSYIESQFEQYFQEELKLQRSLEFYNDTRIHACLYFICPTGHKLKSIDVFCLKQMHGSVNLIPVVAKSDSLSKEELRKFKAAINREFEEQKIKIYHFPTDDEEISDANRNSNKHIPFAVAASGDYAKVGDSIKRARIFPWGTMVVEDEEHSELLMLKQALIEINLEDLREKTHSQFYEKYRKERMFELGFSDDMSLLQFYESKREHYRQEVLKEEEKIKQKFVEKVKVKEAELKALEDTLQVKYNKLFENMRREEKNIRDSQAALEREILQFKNTKKAQQKLRK